MTKRSGILKTRGARLGSSLIRWGLLAAVVVVVSSGDVQACPTCKDTLGANGQRWAEGFYWSILFMLTMPALLVGGPLSDRLGRRPVMVPAPFVALVGSARVGLTRERALEIAHAGSELG